MKRLLMLALIVTGGLVSVSGQRPAPVPRPAPDRRTEILKMIRRQDEANRRIETLRTGGVRNENDARRAAHTTIAELYRGPNKREAELLAVDPELERRHAEFLRRKNTGLAKLMADLGCAENTSVVVASEKCLAYSLPGGGSSYSFRVENYRLPRLADLTFTAGSFQATGVLLHGILVNIGDVPLEEVSLQTNGLRYLNEFGPQTEFEKAREIDRRLIEGVRRDGFLYRRGLYAVENTTFVLRSIAYNGRYWRAVDEITYDEFEFDKRRDVTIAFRIIEKDTEGNVTILWKKLQEKESPEVKGKNKKPAAR